MKRSFWLKRGISVAAAMALLAATTVSAAGDRIVSSTGQYTINNPDGTTVLIDTDDIEANAQAIAGLQGQLGNLSFKYGTEAEVSENSSKDNSKGYYWSKDSSGKWVKIGAVGTAIASDVLTGKKFSSESGVDIEGTMPNPSTASVNTSYGSGNNDKIGATTVSINNSADTTESHDNVEQINLGINESITIPHGYYNKDIVINNGVANRGSTLKALALAYLADNNTEIRDGIYLDYKDAIDSAYAKGVTDGKTGSETKEVDVIYHINHTHGSYCYPTAEPVFVNDKSETKSEYDSDRGTHYNDYGYTAWYKCSVCGATYSATRSTTHEWDFDDGLKSQARTDAYNKVRNNHLVNGTYCPASGYQCGKEDGEQDITDVSVLGAGDTVVSATIKY